LNPDLSIIQKKDRMAAAAADDMPPLVRLDGSAMPPALGGHPLVEGVGADGVLRIRCGCNRAGCPAALATAAVVVDVRAPRLASHPDTRPWRWISVAEPSENVLWCFRARCVPSLPWDVRQLVTGPGMRAGLAELARRARGTAGFRDRPLPRWAALDRVAQAALRCGFPARCSIAPTSVPP
jgi:hypothetical protein